MQGTLIKTRAGAAGSPYRAAPVVGVSRFGYALCFSWCATRTNLVLLVRP